ncbi:ferritin-like domain-containing protein [Haliscomenobacter hydrossis]|uniref:DUF2383 domain-containing protein n=1 Tax=Haliscomenobacter hydrossis (strain ATCC 27775 / DSM 1100 / LMG 10767 / O) TaxID=760192 RepID=F4KVS3_HALH1|nr:PA2169 family four-helix-bundle protein [Haliscomenobacter hydrossis]AEE53498.1 Conserved hypothetical protein CHP02284 [Haliscomenobacter hydrossis DSM 1100]
MSQEKAIGVLNTLIEINNDRIEGYDTASKETEEADLKTLFFHLSQASLKCKRELVYEIRKLGGTPMEETTSTTGKFYRVWMDIKAAFTGNDRKTILNSCEYGEDVAADTYNEALNNNLEYLSPDQQTLLTKQYLLIKAGHDKIKALRDALVEA